MLGKKKKVPADSYEPTFAQGAQPNNEPRTYQAKTHEGQALPGHAGFTTYKVRKKNGMTDLRFNYVRPDGKPDRGSSRYAK